MENEEYAPWQYFTYKNGYEIEAIDLGIVNGVRVTITHPREGSGAILLPADQACKLGEYLLRSMGQKIPCLPTRLQAILQNALDTKGTDIHLKRGDKKRIRETLKIMEWYGNSTKGKGYA